MTDRHHDAGAERPFFDAARVGLDARASDQEDTAGSWISDQELFVDLFAGGGGASEGIEQALERSVDIAVNHDPLALSMHRVNHPGTLHYVSDVFEVDPVTACGTMDVGGLWASFDCKHFSKAKGGKPVDKKIRSLAWVVVKWAKAKRPRVIFAENVEEFQTWGPLLKNNQPCPKRKGETYRRWIRELEALGYVIEWRELRGCDYGAPTIRKRWFMVARCDGLPIVWPSPTHGAPDSLPVKAGKLLPWRTAAECVDWSIPCPSIFERERPLAEATLRRIAKGVMRYVVNAAEPFIVSLTHQGGERVESLREPFKTVTGAHRGEKAIVRPTLAPFLTEHANASKAEHLLISPHVMTMRNAGKPHTAINEPTHTITAGGAHQMLVSAFLAKHYGGVVGSELPRPIGTVTSVDHHSLVASSLVKLRGTSKDGQPVTEPLHTVSAQGQHHGEVRAFLIKYYGADQDPRLEEPLHTVTTKHRFGLVMVAGEPYAIVDIGMRMLSPRELYRAQGFPDTYIIDKGADGKPLTKTAQVRMCGNSVCPPLARAIVRANYTERGALRAAA